MQIKIDDTLRLELLEEKHAEALFNLINTGREYLKEWLSFIDSSTTVDHTKDYIKSARKRYSENNGFDCAVLFKNEVAGQIGLHKIDHSNKITSIGYWLGEGFQGHGIMTKACHALTDYCFNSLYLNRVEIKCARENHRSQAIPERLHFKKEGTIRQAEFLHDKFLDLYLYSMLKEEWKNAK